MVTTGTPTRSGSRRHPGQIGEALRAAGLSLRGPWREHFKVVGSHIVEPDRTPGFLRVDGERLYSSTWL
jgi:hypothetical protein